MKTDSASSGKVVFQKILETVRGGFTLDNTTGFSEGAIIPAGSAVEFNEETRRAKVLKTARVYETAAGSPYKVNKDHNLFVGQFLGKTVGSAAYAITAIDTSNAEYDLVTTGTTLGAVTEGDALFQSSAAGASAAALNVTGAKGLLYDDVVVSKDVTLSVVVRGTVYARRVAVPAPVRAAMPLIIFSESR